MLIGYARVSTLDQDRALQLDALKAAGCEKIFVETASGAKADRPQLAAALDYMREGDCLVVWKLDRLARSMRQLIETVEDLRARQIKLPLADRGDGHDQCGRRVDVPHLRGAGTVRAVVDPGAGERWAGCSVQSWPRRWPTTGRSWQAGPRSDADCWRHEHDWSGEDRRRQQGDALSSVDRLKNLEADEWNEGWF